MKNFNASFLAWSRIGSLSIFAACLLTFVGSIVSVYAATPSTTFPTSAYVHKQVTKYQLPAALCKELKAQFPQKASEPGICTGIHTELSTNFTQIKQSRSMSVRPYSCFAGTKSFRDTNWNPAYSVALNTNWSWDGTCRIPNITYEDCHVNWTLGPTISQENCTQYTTNVPSRAALWTAWQQTGFFGSRIWSRRECYVNINCNWATN